MEGDDKNPPIVILGTSVATDKNGNVCLNDLWKLAGSLENKRARDWYRGKRAQALEAALQERIVEISHKPKKEVVGTTYYTVGRGGGAKTYAHAVLALDFAEYLDASIGVEVRNIFLRYKAHDVSLAEEIIGAFDEQTEYDTERVKLRGLVKHHNRLSAGAAKGADVTKFPAYNGAGLAGLYGGMNKAQLLKHKGLPADAHHLDHADHEELAANYFKATQAIAKLKREGIKGQAAAEEAHREVGTVVRATIKQLGGTMPEDEPALEHIREAEKRLKAAQPKEQKALPSKPPIKKSAG